MFYHMIIKSTVYKTNEDCMYEMNEGVMAECAASLSKLIGDSLHIEHVYEDGFSPASDYELKRITVTNYLTSS